MTKINKPDNPRLLVIAGPNGSGKTSVTGKILKHEWVIDCEYINPDLIARDLFGDWNSNESVMQAAQYATHRREQCINERQSLIFETVLSAPDKVSFVRRAKEAGFFIRLFFIGTDSPEINASRVARRVLEGGHGRGIDKRLFLRYKRVVECEKKNSLCRVSDFFHTFAVANLMVIKNATNNNKEFRSHFNR